MSNYTIAYAYDASLHCPECATKRFGLAVAFGDEVDSEGNPVTALLSPQNDHEAAGDVCDDCRTPLE